MNKKDKIEITGLNIKLGKIDLTLSPKEAKELYNVLGEIFEKETIVEKVLQYKPYPYFPYNWYWINEPEYKYEYGNHTVWCNAENQTLNVSDSASGGVLTETLSPHKINLTNDGDVNDNCY